MASASATRGSSSWVARSRTSGAGRRPRRSASRGWQAWPRSLVGRPTISVRPVSGAVRCWRQGREGRPSGVERETSTHDRDRLEHWIDGSVVEGGSGRYSDVTDPATGEVTARLALASADGGGRAVAAAKAAFPGWRDTSLTRRTEVLFRFRELLNARKRRARRAHHRRARQGALRRARRGQPRPGGRRVRLRDAAPDEGLGDRERLDRCRRALDAAAARSGGDHQPVQLPGHGADVVLPDRDRHRQHGRAQAQREGAVAPRCGWRSCGRRPASPTASSTC